MTVKKSIKFSLLAYAVALCTPVFFGSSHIGLSALGLGWGGLLELNPWVGLPWLANFIYLLNISLKRKNVKTRIGLSALTLLCSSFIFGLTWVPAYGGMREPVTPGIGSMFWILSFLILLLGQIKEMNKKTVNNKTHNQ